MTLPNHNTALEEILSDLYVSTHNGHIPIVIKGSDTEPDILAFQEAQGAINKLMYEETLELIGEDEKDFPKSELLSARIVSRNDLRAVQRQAAAERYGHGSN